MTLIPGNLSITLKRTNQENGERGAALGIAILMLALLSAIAIGVLAIVQGDTRIAGSDLKRTEACYASAAAIERMTNDFSALFAHTSRPSASQLHDIELRYPTELTNEGYTFADHTIALNSDALAAMGTNPAVTIPYGPFSGLIANLKPYTLTTTAQSSVAQCKLSRDMNNYLIPLFQFGMFSDEDIELHPGPDFTFNGRVHANGNIYVNGSVKFLAKVTTANEFLYDVLRNGSTRTGATVSMQVGAVNVAITKGSMTGGPNLPSATASPVGQQGYFPTSPNGTINSNWKSTSIAAATTGTANQFGGQLLTRTTGAAPLKLPLQLDNNPTRELIKRRMPNDSPDPLIASALSDSRYHSKAEIRVLIDDESPTTTDASGIPAGQGVVLSSFDPILLPSAAASATPSANGGGRALWRITDSNTSFSNSYNETATSFVNQQQNGTARQAETVRGVRIPIAKAITGASKTSGNPITITCTGHGFVTGDLVVINNIGGATAANNLSTAPNIFWTVTVVNANTFTLNGTSATSLGTYTANTGTAYALGKSANGAVIPSGAGITGRILIQIVDTNGLTFDVTRQILSMGMTEGEPNSIIQLQRPLWAAFTQGSRDASAAGGANYLTYIINSTYIGADGEILIDATHPSLANGYLTAIADDSAVQAQRQDNPTSNALANLLSGTAGVNWSGWNAVVPINMYNVREGHLMTSVTQNAIYERGITNIVEINMRNLARWMDGVFDQNLLANTNAVSTNIGKPDGYVVYVSDRRGDKVKTMVDSSGATISSTNGMVDNEDIYGPNGTLDAGEDVQNTGALVKDVTELPDAAVLATNPSYGIDRVKRAIAVAAWTNGTGPNHNYFRNAVRLFNGDDLQVSNTVGKLSSTLGITVASENMVYIWGNYNTTGINQAPGTGTSSLNESTASSRYTGDQVPASIVADAFFPLSKTWFDSSSALNPDDYTARRADKNLPGVTSETSVRAGIIAGNNLSALSGDPDADNGGDSRLNGGMHNFPRFMEDWVSDDRRWNFVGSFVPLYHSTQALGQWWYITSGKSIYGAPIRNWAFDTTFLQLDQLPPGTPMFQYVSPTAFRQVL